MVNWNALQEIMGPSEFHAAMEYYKANAYAFPHCHVGHSTMESEPDNCGMTIEEGREALARASEQSFDLPRIPEFEK